VIRRLCLVLLAQTVFAGCAMTHARGRVVSCVDQQPIPDAALTLVEADPDPQKTNVTGNYYYGRTKQDGSFDMVGSGDPATTYWTMSAKKEGFAEGGARYEPGAGPQQICLQPTK